MHDRAPIRDRTLILRILVPGLEARLRDKMKDVEEDQAAAAVASGGGGGGGASSTSNNNNNNNSTKDSFFLDLDGVTCEPTTARNRTLWHFHCDGASYPARLVNLPCPVELHKTHDHAYYYKSADVAQMLIVYEDDIAFEQAEEKPVEGFPSYFHSGVTPPTKRIVERKFAAREHMAMAPPRAAVADVENELMELMEKISKDEKGGGGGGSSAAAVAAANKDSTNKRSKVPTLTSATKVLEEIIDEIVDYEPWMDDRGRQPTGVEFDTEDPRCSLHPEIWLTPESIAELKEQELQARKKKQAAADKKEARRKEKKTMMSSSDAMGGLASIGISAAAAASTTTTTTTKKGIPSKKNAAAAAAAAAAAIAVEEVDEVTQIAASMLKSSDDGFDDLGEDDVFDFDFNDEGINLDGLDL